MNILVAVVEATFNWQSLLADRLLDYTPFSLCYYYSHIYLGVCDPKRCDLLD